MPTRELLCPRAKKRDCRNTHSHLTSVSMHVLERFERCPPFATLKQHSASHAAPFSCAHCSPCKFPFGRTTCPHGHFYVLWRVALRILFVLFIREHGSISCIKKNQTISLGTPQNCEFLSQHVCMSIRSIHNGFRAPISAHRYVLSKRQRSTYMNPTRNHFATTTPFK